jgi:hypothetical protein
MRDVNVSGSQVITPGVESFLHRDFDPSASVRQGGDDNEGRDGPPLGLGRSLWVSVWRIRHHDVTALGHRVRPGPPPQRAIPGFKGEFATCNDYSSAVQRCLSADKSVREMNRASPDWGKRPSSSI